MTTSYWPWWLGGAMLAIVALAFPLLAGAPLGVSGALARLLRWGAEGRPRSTGGNQSPAEVTGSAPIAGLPRHEGTCGAPIVVADSVPQSEPDRVANLLFLLGMLIGGGLAGWAGGQTWEHARLSPEFHRLLGSGLPAVAVLFGGGVLVGFGTRLSGGCTSGHGLSGCGRLQPASLIATAVFFGAAIAVSFLLERLHS